MNFPVVIENIILNQRGSIRPLEATLSVLNNVFQYGGYSGNRCGRSLDE